jgi:hypothetical protein
MMESKRGFVLSYVHVGFRDQKRLRGGCGQSPATRISVNYFCYSQETTCAAHQEANICS